MLNARLLSIPLLGWSLLAMLFGGAAGISSYTFTYAQGFSYFSDDPQACVNCHVMRDVYDAWSHGSHRAVAACNDCHTPHNSLVAKYYVKAVNGFNHSRAFTLGNYPEPITITEFNRDVAYRNCLTCHGELVTAISHTDGRQPTDCLQCHSDVGHRTRK
jgi:cytochrome c nitrite reductase small subunit